MKKLPEIKEMKVVPYGIPLPDHCCYELPLDSNSYIAMHAFTKDGKVAIQTRSKDFAGGALSSVYIPAEKISNIIQVLEVLQQETCDVQQLPEYENAWNAVEVMFEKFFPGIENMQLKADFINELFKEMSIKFKGTYIKSPENNS